MPQRSSKPRKFGLGVTYDPQNSQDYKVRLWHKSLTIFVGRFGSTHEARVAYDHSVACLQQLVGETSHRTNYERNQFPPLGPDVLQKIEARVTAALRKKIMNDQGAQQVAWQQQQLQLQHFRQVQHMPAQLAHMADAGSAWFLAGGAVPQGSSLYNDPVLLDMLLAYFAPEQMQHVAPQ